MPAHRPRSDERGATLVEFALVLLPFLLLLFGLLDLGRGVYTYNASAQAAREIARVTSVHPFDACCALGTSTEANAVKTQQKRVVPGLNDAGIVVECVDVLDAAIPADDCSPGDYIRVTVSTTFRPVTPLLGQLGPYTLRSISHVQRP